MYPVRKRCPVCFSDLEVTRLYCRSCDSTLEGHFELGRFYRLSPEQMRFVETFIKCEGKITRVEEELGISYPTVRSRLNKVIRALGYEVPEEEAVTPERRREILERVQKGEIRAKKAVELLRGK